MTRPTLSTSAPPRRRRRRRHRVACLVPALAVAGCSDPVEVPREVSDTEGAIDIVVLTSGADPDGVYRLQLDGRLSWPVPPGGTLTLPLLEPGVHSVFLQQIATNCTVDGSNPRDAEVSAAARSTVTFSVVCTSTTGFVRVTATTSGTDPDPDGYTISAPGIRSGDPAPRIGTTGATVVPAVPIGPGVVALGDVTPNCDPVGPLAQTVLVPSADTVDVTFDVVCRPVQRLAYAAPVGPGADIYTVNSNGTDRTRITSDPALDDEPAWSPDGARIAFSTDRDGNREIYVMSFDGSDPTRLTNDPGADLSPAWSPDGMRIAFIAMRDGVTDLYIMNADGSGTLRLTADDAADADPAWSPDGSTIAFTKHLPSGRTIYRVGPDGEEAAPIADDIGDASDPAWSPDGTRLAVVRLACDGFYACNDGIAIVDADGSSLEALPVSGASPAWSPDGRNLSYAAIACDFYGYECWPAGIGIIRSDGTLPFTLAADGATSAWRQP